MTQMRAATTAWRPRREAGRLVRSEPQLELSEPSEILECLRKRGDLEHSHRDVARIVNAPRSVVEGHSNGETEHIVPVAPKRAGFITDRVLATQLAGYPELVRETVVRVTMAELEISSPFRSDGNDCSEEASGTAY